MPPKFGALTLVPVRFGTREPGKGFGHAANAENRRQPDTKAENQDNEDPAD
ncbi:MAG: hypothetical protein NT116_00050 [Candidatus Parcubacteria bacterium]|nr:hypothetical protein [Candidatus Parcubacteria bacterium]